MNAMASAFGTECHADAGIDYNMKGTTTNTLMYDGTNTVVGSSQNNSYPTTTGIVKAGFNYARGARSLGAYYRYNPERGDFKNTGAEWLDSDPVIKREIERPIKGHSHLASVYYENTFSDRYTLHFDGDFRQSQDRSYKMATVKPPYSQLTGSLSYVGLHEIEGGNPALHDEHMHDLQLFGMWKGFMLQTDFTSAVDTYAYVKQLYPADDLQLLMHPVNIDVTALNLYLAWSKPVRRWTPNFTVGLYRQWLNLDGTDYDRPIFSYYLDNTFSLPHGWLVTANISGQSGGDMHTNRFGTTWLTMNASLGKTFLDKTLTVKLSATDIFNTSNNDWTMNTYGVSVDKRQSYDRRGISLNVIYSFQPRKSSYKGSSASEAEMRRL